MCKTKETDLMKEEWDILSDKELVKYLIVAGISAVCNLIFYRNTYGAVFQVIVEVSILLWVFLKKQYTQYLCFYLIFMSTSLEYGVYYGIDVLGLKGFRFLGITLGVWLLLPPAFIALFKMKIIKGKRERKYIQLLRFERFTLGIVLISVFMGILQILVNDNGMMNFDEVWKEFILGVYSKLTLVAIPVYTFVFFVFYDSSFVKKMKKTLLAILISIIIAQSISCLFQITGEYWENPTLIVSQVAIFTPYLLLFMLYKNIKEKLIFLFIGVLGSYFAFQFAFGSGPLLIFMVMPVLAVWILLQNRKYKIVVGGILCLFFLLFFLNCVDIGKIQLSVLLEYKLKQAVYMLQFWKADWLENMPNSAKYRVIEFLSIAMEFVNKPFYIFFGKGILGSFSDFFGFIEAQGETLAAYSAFEWKIGHYFSVHESVNVLFLSNGILGLIFVIYMVWTCLKNLKFSPFLAIGMMWILFYWDYSTVLSYFGIMCLVIGLAMVGERRNFNGN